MSTDPEADVIARGRALSSPTRMRILRICLHRERTNKEIADVLGVSPAACLHHVRTLERAGFLVAQEPRRGKRGAREIPYRATGASWDTPVADQGDLLVQTFLEELSQVPLDQVASARLGLRLNDESKAELDRRLQEVLVDFKERQPDPDGRSWSLFIAYHPDPQAD